MKIEYHKVFWHDHKPSDDNNGLVYGVSGDDDVENFYIEWFKTEEERNIKLFLKITQKMKCTLFLKIMMNVL